ncbi:MAG: glutamine synthetase family protein [Candidatus Fimivivens sp.]|nr:glutamine synthetase family protein [Candidatus Fimivivens sp.]
MNCTENEVLEYIKENDVKFIRLAFCDLFGIQKSISITADELPRAFAGGISFDASVVEGFLNADKSDLFLFPDPSTLAAMPWRPSRGGAVSLICEVRRPDGSLFEGDTRALLKKACARADEMGYSCQIGPEYEFYLFELDERSNPTRQPIDRAGYMDIPPADRGENIRRDICLTLEKMGVKPESFHHESGPGQNEIDFHYSDALIAADQLITFKGVVKEMAAQNGMYASFMPKPLEGMAGSGLHVNMSLVKDGRNIFMGRQYGHCPEAESFIAGILAHVREITAFLNPTTNSYRRFGAFEAPQYVAWSHSNRSHLIRIPAVDGEHTRMELRSPDPTCNPYLAFALLMHAGFDGIDRKLVLPQAAVANVSAAAPEELMKYEKLPASLGEALDSAEQSAFVKRVLPADTLQGFVAAKRREQAALDNAEYKNKCEQQMYFERY